MSTFQSVYVKDSAVADWFITLNGTNIKGFIFCKFRGTVAEAEKKTDEIKNRLWKEWYGDAFQHSFSGPTLLADLYSETEWTKISQNNLQESSYPLSKLENENFYTFFG